MRFHPVRSPVVPRPLLMLTLLQFEVSIPHIIYAALGGFVVFVSPYRASIHAMGSPVWAVWHVLSIHSRKGTPRSSACVRMC